MKEQEMRPEFKKKLLRMSKGKSTKFSSIDHLRKKIEEKWIKILSYLFLLIFPEIITGQPDSGLERGARRGFKAEISDVAQVIYHERKHKKIIAW